MLCGFTAALEQEKHSLLLALEMWTLRPTLLAKAPTLALHHPGDTSSNSKRHWNLILPDLAKMMLS